MTFNDINKCKSWEHKILNKFNAASQENWLNQSNNGEVNNAGKKASEETKEKMRLKSLGRKHTKKTIKKLKNIKGELHHGFGKPAFNSGKKMKDVYKNKEYYEEHMEKMKILMTENNPFKGKKHSKESIQKIIEANIRTKASRSEKFKGNNFGSLRINTKHSEETRLKIGTSNKNKVSCFDLKENIYCSINSDMFHTNKERYCGVTSSKIPLEYRKRSPYTSTSGLNFNSGNSLIISS